MKKNKRKGSWKDGLPPVLKVSRGQGVPRVRRGAGVKGVIGGQRLGWSGSLNAKKQADKAFRAAKKKKEG